MKLRAQVVRVEGRLVVASVSPLYGGAPVVDGWTHVLQASEATPQALGMALREGLAAVGSEEALGALPKGASPISSALGFDSENAMLREQVELASVLLKGRVWRIVPMANEGPGRGFAAAPDAVILTHEGEWSDAEVGQAVLDCLDTLLPRG